jgi:V8-like Glu-specific endopeptidase
MGRAPSQITVIPGRPDRDGAPYGRIIASRYFAPRFFIRPKHRTGADLRELDYGIIILPKPFEQLRQFMQLRALDDGELNDLKHNRLISVAGYPGDRPSGTLWRHAERLRRFTPTRLFYTVDTCPGHSGSPIFTASKQGGMNTIVGIHTSGIVDERGRPYGCGRDTVLAPPGMMNSGIRITQEVLANISAVKQRAGGATQSMVMLP